MEREVERLEEIDFGEAMEIIKSGDREKYENEFLLLKVESGLPTQFVALDEKVQQMALLFIDKEFEEENSGERTYGNAYISYIATLEDKSVLKKVYQRVWVDTPQYGSDGMPIQKEVIRLNPEYMNVYLKLKAQASSVMKKYLPKELIRTLREIVTNSGMKDEELLANAILDDALSNDKSSYTARMRALAVKVTGLEKQTSLSQINVYVDGGGSKLNETIIESSGNDNYDLGYGDE